MPPKLGNKVASGNEINSKIYQNTVAVKITPNTAYTCENEEIWDS